MMKIDLKKLTNSALRGIIEENKKFIDYLEKYTSENDFNYYDVQEIISNKLDRIEEVNKIMVERVKGKDSYLFDD